MGHARPARRPRPRDRLARQIETLPLNYVVLNMKWGSLSAAQSLRTLELFATKIRFELPLAARGVT
jgi:hypothetical protein